MARGALDGVARRSAAAGLENVAPSCGSLDDPYFLAFQLVVEMITRTQHVQLTALGEQVASVFDQHHLSGKAGVLYASVKGDPNQAHRDRMGTIAFADMRRVTPLLESKTLQKA